MTKMMEMIVWPLFILVLGIELAELADAGLMEIMLFFGMDWLEGSSNWIKTISLFVYFCMWAMAAYVLSQGVEKGLQYMQKTQDKTL